MPAIETRRPSTHADVLPGLAGRSWEREAAGMRPRLFCSSLNPSWTAPDPEGWGAGGAGLPLLSQGAGRRPMLRTTNKAAEEAALVLHAAHAHTMVTLQINHVRTRQGLWTPEAFTPPLETPHLAISHADTEAALPLSPVYPASWKDLLSLQAGRNPPCPSKAFSSPNIVFISPSPPFFILNKNIITGF